MIWWSVQKLALTLNFDLDVEQQAIGEGDGTGFPIRDVNKPGKEFKVLVQHKKPGGVRVTFFNHWKSPWGLLSVDQTIVT